MSPLCHRNELHLVWILANYSAIWQVCYHFLTALQVEKTITTACTHKIYFYYITMIHDKMKVDAVHRGLKYSLFSSSFVIDPAFT